MDVIKNHREGVLLVDFKNSNPQGDPDAENRPRTDPELSHGLITAHGPKRKIRDFLALRGHALYVARGACLERLNLDAAKAVGCEAVFENELDDEDAEDEDASAKTRKRSASKAPAKKVKPTPESSRAIFGSLADKYIDFRLFGGTVPRLSGTGRGPVQFTMGESIDPVTPIRMAITRVAVATEEEAKKQAEANRGMGGLWYIPYGLYRFHWYISPNDARRTKMTEADYDLFIEAVLHMFDNDRSSVRASGCVRLFYEFRHKETLKGSLSGERLLERVRVFRRNDSKPARSFGDYTVEVHPSVGKCRDLELRKIVDVVDWDAEHAAE